MHLQIRNIEVNGRLLKFMPVYTVLGFSAQVKYFVCYFDFLILRISIFVFRSLIAFLVVVNSSLDFLLLLNI